MHTRVAPLTRHQVVFVRQSFATGAATQRLRAHSPRAPTNAGFGFLGRLRERALRASSRGRDELLLGDRREELTKPSARTHSALLYSASLYDGDNFDKLEKNSLYIWLWRFEFAFRLVIGNYLSRAAGGRIWCRQCVVTMDKRRPSELCGSNSSAIFVVHSCTRSSNIKFKSTKRIKQKPDEIQSDMGNKFFNE